MSSVLFLLFYHFLCLETKKVPKKIQENPKPNTQAYAGQRGFSAQRTSRLIRDKESDELDKSVKIWRSHEELK